ncbi:MAG TPA: hypothetical protein ENO12_02260 [Thermoplasmatales archaeon]|nr:hypothetical protein [Thermoplasmatales archaeon]
MAAGLHRSLHLHVFFCCHTCIDALASVPYGLYCFGGTYLNAAVRFIDNDGIFTVNNKEELLCSAVRE